MVLFWMIFIVAPFWPTSTQAQEVTVPAGFAPSSVWLSRTEPVSGEPIRIYTALYNSSENSLEGSVSFLVDSSELETIPFILSAGDSKILTAMWTPEEGRYSVSARISNSIETKSKEARVLSSTTREPLSVTVSSPPQVPATLLSLSTASAIASSSAPQVASVISKAASATEALRNAGESYLLGLVTPPIPSEAQKKGLVLGTETNVPEVFIPENTNPTLIQQAAKVLLPVFANKALFYLAFIGILLFLFFLLIRRMRSPRRR